MRLLPILLTLAALSARPRHGVRPERLVIRVATVIEGNGTPAAGPVDIAIENGVIAAVGRAPKQPGDVEIDAKGKYVTPGLINMHGHPHNERGGVGSPLTKARNVRAKGETGKIAAPRLFIYPLLGRVREPEAARRRVQEIRKAGADGMKIAGAWRDTMDAELDEAHKLGLPFAQHIGVEETRDDDAIRNKASSIEHWYGIPDAAIPGGVRNFPSSYNYLNEADRFRCAGRLWREANWERLTKLFDSMIANNVAWDPTLEIYEASRDLQRTQTQPRFRDCPHPVLEVFFRPNLENPGSYFLNWSSTDEAFWKENYQLWMRVAREFARRGGVVTVGEDAGFHPLQIPRQATLNGARVLGQEKKLGRVRGGWAADLLVIDGNPLEDFKLLYPASANAGVKPGVQWAIKGGTPFSAPQLMQEVKTMEEKARHAK